MVVCIVFCCVFLCWGFLKKGGVVCSFQEICVGANMEVMDSLEFQREVVEFMGVLGLSDLENSGLRFPAVDWDWQDCCHACVWLGFLGYELPGNLMARMVLGPSNPLVALYLKWLQHKSSVRSIWELAG